MDSFQRQDFQEGMIFADFLKERSFMLINSFGQGFWRACFSRILDALAEMRTTLEQPHFTSHGNDTPESRSSGVLELRWSKFLPGKSLLNQTIRRIPQSRETSPINK
jgi:hypothetical protein